MIQYAPQRSIYAAEYAASTRRQLLYSVGLGRYRGTDRESRKNTLPRSSGMAVSTVPGHAGEWICGSVGEKDVLLMSGRLHPYEGHSMRDVVMPIYIMKMLGIETVVVTNAAGAINTSYSAGDMMIITDHINFTAKNPLTGENDDRLGTRFPDMSAAYDKVFQSLL